MSESEPPVDKRIEETKSGVKVECKSKRGSGTRDQDTVTAYAYYDSVGEASANSSDLVETVRFHLQKLRRLDDKGRETRS